MEKTTHLFDEGIYHISNQTTARTPMFVDESDQEFFIEKLDKYLGNICQVMEYRLYRDHYRLVLKIKNREEVESFFSDKYEEYEIKANEIPATTYIFSQQMSNFQVSYAKKMNFKYNREGSFFRSRFDRKLIEGEAEMNAVKESILKGERFFERSSVWMMRDNQEWHRRESIWNSGGIEEGEESPLGCYIEVDKDNLGGYFKNTPPKHLFPKFIRQIIKIYKLKYRFGPNRN